MGGAASAVVDPTKNPHYYGPWPNWANSPFTLPDAHVSISTAAGCVGSGATADATLGANGGIAAITVTSPGNDYASSGKCLPTVTITGAGSGAAAKATVTRSGALVGIAVDTPGSGYINPRIGFSGGGGSGARATAYGGVEKVVLLSGGSGYTFPTVQFDLPDAPDGVQAEGTATIDANGTVTGITVTTPGSGYSTAPGVAVLNGTQFEPIPLEPGGSYATFPTANDGAPKGAPLFLQSIALDAFGSGYNNPPNVTIDDPVNGGGGGSGATAHAAIDTGAITAITVTSPGSNYVTTNGIKKFVDTLPGLGPSGKNNLNNYIPIADTTKNQNAADGWAPATWKGPAADYYWIGLVQYKQKMHSSLPATQLRGYVQLTFTPTANPIQPPNQTTLNGQQLYSVDPAMYLGPTIVATKDKPVRVKFTNLLPSGDGGDLFLPVDSTLAGSGAAGMGDTDMTPMLGGTVDDEARNPVCTDAKSLGTTCFTKNRATLHLHGGNTPWISDGTTHQWTTPAGEATTWPTGVSVKNVPDMADPGPGSLTFYYSNQQSARLLFYHDHAWGITRLNVYAGEAAGYVLTDPTEQKLITNSGPLAGLGVGTPLVIQDKTFVPDDAQLYDTASSYGQDPTWDKARWGGKGNLWYHHVYMPVQNPGDPSGISAFGRWMYGPWFWPPAADAKHGPIANPYYNMDPGTGFTTPLAQPCDLNDPGTWQYDTDPFCEPELIPGTPNVSVGMEQFNDTPVVNGVAYPTVTLDPKTYRFRVLSGANDRFFNLQWYVADATGTEVALKAAEVEAAQTDPTVFPTPDTTKSPPGPSWIQIGTEGGFLPSPVVVPNQPTTWITDPTRFDVGNVDKHSLLLAPAERADVIVDFSQFAGKTLILYNDAPAAFPARVPGYDYYTGGPDLSPAGAPTTLPGYGPNTRTVMQVKIRPGSSKAFNLNALRAAFNHKADGSGVFESGQHPIIVGQAGYNAAYGKSFVGSGDCSNTAGTNRCDGYARINQQGGTKFRFDTLRGPQLQVPIEPKAIHDETNSTAFDEFGRMQATLGLEAVPATPGRQNVILHPFVYPGTEIIDASMLPSADVRVTPIAAGDDGTQIWKITHNGVDTHPIHWHAYDVQVLNRVTWDNIIIPPDATELGWKDTVRISPLEDTIVALRPVRPKLPFDIPNSVRLLSPMQTNGAWIANTTGAQASGLPLLAFAPNGDPIDIVNHWVNFGEEYTYHCHILSHEEMDMMRPVSIATPPLAPSGLAFDPATKTLRWTDNALSETQFVVQKSTDGTNWTPVGSPVRTLFNVDGGPGPLMLPALLPDANTSGGTYSLVDPAWVAGVRYRVVAQNVVGDAWNYANPNLNGIVAGGFPTVTAQSISTPLPT